STRAACFASLGLWPHRVASGRIWPHQPRRARCVGLKSKGCPVGRALAAQPILQDATNWRLVAAPPPERHNQRRVLGAVRLARGGTDYVAIISRFATEGIIGEMDGVYSSWATRVPDGFSDDQIATLQRIAPYLALAIKSVSL